MDRPFDATTLENRVREFVRCKTGEEVKLTIAPTCVSVQHAVRRGCTTLATFWIRVLQHRINFPSSEYNYRQLVEPNGSQKLILKVKPATLTVFMKTGKLTVEAQSAIEWFRRRFIEIMTAFDDATSFEPADYGLVGEEYNVVPNDLFHGRTFHRIQQQDTPQDTRDSPPMNQYRDTRSDPGHNPHSEAGGRGRRPGTRGSVNSEVTLDSTTARITDGSLSGPFRLLDVSDQIISRWCRDLSQELETLMTGAVRSGPHYVYPLWKDLLDEWFSEGYRVYLASPFLDSDRLLDIVRATMRVRRTSELAAIYTRNACHRDTKLAQIMDRILHDETFSAADKLYIEYKVFNKCVYPVNTFNGKFVAGVKEGQAEVLVTSANFTAEHFVNENMETVIYLKMSEKQFVDSYLSPLIE